MVALAQQLRPFHEAVRARSHVQERSALVQMMQGDAVLLADLSIVLAGHDQPYRTLLTAWRNRHTLLASILITTRGLGQTVTASRRAIQHDLALW